MIVDKLNADHSLENLETIRVRLDADIAFIQISRPENRNAINDALVDEFHRVLCSIEDQTKIVVVEGLPDVFCSGADFAGISEAVSQNRELSAPDPTPMYEVWQKLAFGDFVSIARVRGQANAGGVGFVAACDVVIADTNASFALSELLFGLMPACVLPFLIQRVGYAKANTMTVLTEPVTAEQAYSWGLVDELTDDTDDLVRKKLLRLRRVSKKAIQQYKRYMMSINQVVEECKRSAIHANQTVFSDPKNIENIHRFIHTGAFPWE